MNAYAERFIGSVRRELLDNFIIFSYNQLFSLLKKYVRYYNNMRPHQGIGQQTTHAVYKKFVSASFILNKLTLFIYKSTALSEYPDFFNRFSISLI